MRVVLILAIFIFSLHAQTIQKLEFDGLVHLSELTASEAVGIKPGDTLESAEVDKAIKELYEYGYFEDIQVFFDEGTLRFELSTKPVISHINLSGYKERDQESILEHLGLKKGAILDAQKLQDARSQIMELLEYEGYYDSVVEFDQEREGSSVRVEVQVRTGEKIKLRQQRFVGNEYYDSDEIEEVLQNKQEDFLGWMWGRNDGVVKVAELPNDKQRIKDLYMKAGFLDATVQDGLLEAEFGSYTAKQQYRIDEGKQYTVSRVDFSEARALEEKKALRELTELNEGETFDIEKLRNDLKGLKNHYADMGYAYTRTSPRVMPNSDDHTVEVTYEIEPGQKVYINDVIISGNTKTIDRVIRREVHLAPGDLYSITDKEDSINALKRTGYFKDVQIKEKRVASDKIDLEINIKEQQTGSLVFGIGYGSYDGMVYNIQVSDKNIFGSGLDVSADVEKSDKRNSYNVSLTNPRVWDSRYSTGFSIFDQDYTAHDYEENNKGGSVFVGRRLSRHWKGNLRLSYTDTDLDYDAGVGLEDETYDKGSIIPSVSFNNTDNYYFPKNGIKFNTSLEYAGAVGKEEFIKNRTSFAAFYGLKELTGYDMVLRYKASGGIINDRGYLHINEKFYLGGVGDVRGYASNSLSPRNDQGYRIGGKRTFANSVEASIPLIESANMRLAFFYDYGMIGEDSFDQIDRSGAGAAIEWLSPMGPLQLIFAKALDDEEGDETSTFEFSLGRSF